MWKWEFSGNGKSWELKVKKIIINIVIITSKKLVLKPKFDDAKTVGINKKITNGFEIPPVKYSNEPNWIISMVKKINADLSESCVLG